MSLDLSERNNINNMIEEPLIETVQEDLKVETSAHHLPGTVRLADTQAGPIYRMPIPHEEDFDFEKLEIPEFLLLETSTDRRSKRLAVTFHWNSKVSPDALGRPNSAFLILRGSELYIDHLLENHEHDRKESPVLHDIMRKTIGYGGNNFAVNRTFLEYSGHIAPLNISTRDVAYVMEFDAFDGRKAYEDATPNMQGVIRALWKARIAPITSDGKLIAPASILTRARANTSLVNA